MRVDRNSAAVVQVIRKCTGDSKGRESVALFPSAVRLWVGTEEKR